MVGCVVVIVGRNLCLRGFGDMELGSVAGVVAGQLCNSCGGCLGGCPRGAIELVENVAGNLFPVVNDNCNNCGLCLKVCAGLGVGEKALAGLAKSGVDPFMGTALGAFTGKAVNSTITNNSQSGGVTTAILSYALDQNIVQGVLTVKSKKGNPPRPEVYIATDSKSLLDGQKSKYCPVPLLAALPLIQQF